jgi:hypothetical protein
METRGLQQRDITHRAIVASPGEPVLVGSVLTISGALLRETKEYELVLYLQYTVYLSQVDVTGNSIPMSPPIVLTI